MQKEISDLLSVEVQVHIVLLFYKYIAMYNRRNVMALKKNKSDKNEWWKYFYTN